MYKTLINNDYPIEYMKIQMFMTYLIPIGSWSPFIKVVSTRVKLTTFFGGLNLCGVIAFPCEEVINLSSKFVYK